MREMLSLRSELKAVWVPCQAADFHVSWALAYAADGSGFRDRAAQAPRTPLSGSRRRPCSPASSSMSWRSLALVSAKPKKPRRYPASSPDVNVVELPVRVLAEDERGAGPLAGERYGAAHCRKGHEYGQSQQHPLPARRLIRHGQYRAHRCNEQSQRA